MLSMNPDWDERYGAQGFLYGTSPNDFLAEVAPRLKKKGRVLSLGEGEGRNGVYLASLGFDVTGVDGSRVGLAKAQQLARTKGVALETVTADLTDFTITPGAWDGIVSIWCHLPSAIRAAVHAQAVRGLAPGGAFVLEAYRPEQLAYKTGGPKDKDFLPSLEDLRKELAGLDFEIGRELDRDVHEGALHHGKSAVVQVLAIRRG
jgi:SAM-dependent methyltransferase